MNIILLKHGKKYTADDVNRQAEKLMNYVNYPIFCFTEDPKDVIIDCIEIPKKPKLAKWWNKLHVFRHDFVLGDRCVMFDLDIDIIDNPFPYIESIDWRVPHFIRDGWKDDLYWESHAYETKLNSSIMAWTSYRNTEIWDKFSRNIDYNTRKYAGIDRYVWDHKFNYKTFDSKINETIIL
tara:strand:- start:560 stop:1099 length:540 start_codon:yes stop_codon:yes gene_type:complete